MSLKIFHANYYTNISAHKNMSSVQSVVLIFESNLTNVLLFFIEMSTSAVEMYALCIVVANEYFWSINLYWVILIILFNSQKFIDPSIWHVSSSLSDVYECNQGCRLDPSYYAKASHASQALWNIYSFDLK